MKLTVRTLAKKQIVVNVEESCLVGELKALVTNKEGVDVERQRLIFMGQELEDDKLLVDYFVRDKSTLHVVFVSDEQIRRSNSLCTIT